MPGDGRITFNEGGAWAFPEQTVLVKTFAVDVEGAGRRRVETRLLTLQQGQWYGYSYRWNEKQTDAVLVSAGGSDQEFVTRGGRRQTWHYPSRTECMVCHSRAAGFVLGLNTLQMNKQDEPAHGSGSQLRRFQSLDAFDALPKQDRDYHKLANPDDPSADMELRVRSYLHANCAQCHVWAGGGNSAIDLHFNTARENMGLIDVPPVHDSYGIRDARLVAPGAPERSILYHRVTKRGAGRMPPLGSVVVDQAAAALLADWIRQLKPTADRRP